MSDTDAGGTAVAPGDGAVGAESTPEPDPVELSATFLKRVRMEESTHAVESRLRDLDRGTLARGLETDAERLAFWINVYNAVAQSALAAAPELFEDRRAFFDADLVAVAGRDMSLNDVEHYLLRGGRPVWGLGYVRDPFRSAFVEAFGVRELDPRLHFALNCGAAACPPIAAYSRDIDAELDLATGSYLDQEVEYDPDTGVVRAPRLLLWFLGDFGGRSGAVEFLREHGAIPEDASPKLRFKQYDWSLSLGEFERVEDW